jgi:hypothetical protein
MHMEKRIYARLELHAKGFIHWDDQHIEGEVENVSVKGAFVMADSLKGINGVVAFTIDNTSTCDRKAKVVRVTDKGVGLQFEKPLLD